MQVKQLASFSIIIYLLFDIWILYSVYGTGENIIDNENLSLLDIGLHDGAIIILELAEANTKKCLLNVIRVTGNNTGYKYTPSASEIKTNPFEIRVRANTTMCKLKETIVSRIGCTTSSSVEVTPKPVVS